MKQRSTGTQTLDVFFFLAHLSQNQMQTRKPFGHRRMYSRIRHGSLTVPLRVCIVPVGFRRFRGFDLTNVINEADDGTTVVRTVEFVMVLLIEIDCGGSLILVKHSLLTHDIHGIDPGKKHIPTDLAGAKFAHRSFHYRGCGSTPINAPDSRILSLETILNGLHHVTLEGTENRDFALFSRCLDEVPILPAGASRNQNEREQNQGEIDEYSTDERTNLHGILPPLIFSSRQPLKLAWNSHGTRQSQHVNLFGSA